MIRNYLITAWRNILRYRFVSFTNLFGITVGLTCCLLILCYVLNELSFDQFKNSDRIYRVTRSFNTEGGTPTLNLGSVAPPVGPLLQNDFPDIRKITRILPVGSAILKFADKTFNEQNVCWSDANFFDFFSVRVIKGNPKAALAEPYSMMLTPEIARKFFGQEDPINKMVQINDQFIFKVAGVFEPFPATAHLHPEILLSFSTLEDPAIYGKKNLETSWSNNSFYTYLMLPPHYSIANMEKQFPAFLDKHVTFSETPAGDASKTTALHLQQLRDIHLHSHLDSEIEPNGDVKLVYIFSAIALFILLIACINYMNLATARSVLRAKEIGIRKTIGAQRRELILQFLSESILITLAASLLALLLTWLLWPYMEQLADRKISIRVLWQWPVIIPLLLLPFVIGLLSGIYPAMFMSSFKPITVLKGLLKAGGQAISFRKVLVILQFTISMVLILATAVVFQQLHYIQNASLGFNKDHILTISYNSTLDGRYEAFRTALLQDPDIKELGLSSRVPSGRLLDEMGVNVFADDSSQPANLSLKYVAVNDGFIPVYGIKMAAGRNFQPGQFPSDSSNFIINEASIQMLGWKNNQDAIGKDLTYGGVKGKMIGVTKNFHFESMHQKIIPLLFFLGSMPNHSFGTISVKIGGTHINSSIDRIKKTWNNFVPASPFNYTFLDERFARLYTAEQRQELIFTIFACIAMFIACLGLFGLSAFTISQRAKEIGIRKVLGASLNNIVGILSKDFLKLVGIAALIALPAGWICMHRWLQGFAYHIQIQWWLLLFAASIAALIAILTIGLQAAKAALTNPVEALRSE